MMNNSENEKINEPAKETGELEENFSTVFSSPTAHKKSADDVKRKKLLPIIISSFLIVAILIGGTVAVIKLIPEKEEGNNTVSAIEDIKVLSLKSDDFKTVTVNNSNGTFKLYSVTEKSDDSSETSETVNWLMEGYKDGILDSYGLNNIAESAAEITASREVTEKTAADCGLDKPSVNVTVATKESKEFSVLIGDESPDKSGYYLKVSDSEKIYVVGSEVKSGFDFTPLSLANTDMLPAFSTDNVSSDYKSDDGTLTTCDKLVIKGKNFPEPVVIEANKDDKLATVAAFRITSPVNRIAENIDGVFDAFKSGISVSGAYALDVSDKTVKSLGLDNPDFAVTMSIGKSSYTFKFALQPDGDYAAISDSSEIVKKVSAETIPFINYKATDFYSGWVCLVSIDDIKEFSFTIGDKAYTFGIEKNPDEEAEDKYIVTYNGKKIASSPFQDFYQDCISINYADFSVDKASGKPDYSIIFKYNDDIGGNQTVEFIKFSETKYQCTVDGVSMGKVTASSLKSLENSLETLLK